MAPPIEAIYLFDPLCGWCYGASPMIDALATQAGVILDLMPVGLFVGEGAFTITPGFAQYVLDADRRIAAVSGQPFSEAYRENVLGDINGMVDSGPATLALTAVRMEAPARQVEVLTRLQQVRYVDGLNTSHLDVVCAVLSGAGLASLVPRLNAPDAALLEENAQRIATGRDLMRRFQVRGVPALLAGRGRFFNAVPSSVLFGCLSDLLAAVG